MGEYRGNALADVERAVVGGRRGLTLTTDQMAQVLAEHAALVEKANELVRENDRLRRGEFTEAESQDLCHNLTADDQCRFRAGCEAYQRKLFGPAAGVP